MNLPFFELSYVLQYGYVAFFLIIFVSEFLGFLPVGLFMIAMGAFAREGYFSLTVLLAIATVAGIASNLIIYSGARYFSAQPGYQKKTRKNRFARQVEAHMQTQPWLTIFVSRFIGLISFPATIIAGLTRVPRGMFVLGVGLGNLICSLIYLMTGYLIGAAWEVNAHLASRIGLVAVAFVIVGYVLYYVITNRTQSA
jgi:membrane-associated protein